MLLDEWLLLKAQVVGLFGQEVCAELLLLDDLRCRQKILLVWVFQDGGIPELVGVVGRHRKVIHAVLGGHDPSLILPHRLLLRRQADARKFAGFDEALSRGLDGCDLQLLLLVLVLLFLVLVVDAVLGEEDDW